MKDESGDAHDEFMEEDYEVDENDESLIDKLLEIGDSGRNKHKTFEGIPK